jgi:hypothetical protein
MRIGGAIDQPPPSTTRLGDWYANLLFTRRGQFILCVSQRTLLPIIVPARDAKSLLARLRDALPRVLSAIGVNPAVIDHELAEMAEGCFAKTANRTVLGLMNDLALNAAFDALWRLAWRQGLAQISPTGLCCLSHDAASQLDGTPDHEDHQARREEPRIRAPMGTDSVGELADEPIGGQGGIGGAAAGTGGNHGGAGGPAIHLRSVRCAAPLEPQSSASIT